MGIGELHASFGEPVHVGCGNPGFGIVTAHIPVPHIICEDKNDVWIVHWVLDSGFIFRSNQIQRQDAYLSLYAISDRHLYSLRV